MKYYFFVLVLFISFGCRDTNKKSEKDQVISEQQQKIKELQDQLDKKEIEDNPRDTRNPNYDVYKDPDLVQIDFGKYVFAIIKTQDKRAKVDRSESGMPMPGEEIYNVTDVSGIYRVEFYNEEKKAKFKDLVRSKAAMTRYWNPKIFSVEVKEYASYKEASEARDKIEYHSEVQVTLPKNF